MGKKNQERKQESRQCVSGCFIEETTGRSYLGWVEEGHRTKTDEELRNVLKFSAMNESVTVGDKPDSNLLFYTLKLTTGDFDRMDELKKYLK